MYIAIISQLPYEVGAVLVPVLQGRGGGGTERLSNLPEITQPDLQLRGCSSVCAEPPSPPAVPPLLLQASEHQQGWTHSPGLCSAPRTWSRLPALIFTTWPPCLHVHPPDLALNSRAHLELHASTLPPLFSLLTGTALFPFSLFFSPCGTLPALCLPLP